MNEFWNLARISMNSLCVLALMFVMSNFKCSAKTARCAWLLTAAVSFGVNTVIYCLAGRTVMMRFFAVTTAVPCLIALLVLTKDRFPQLFFNFFTAVNALYLVSVIGLTAASGPEKLIWLDMLVRLALYGGILFLFQRYFSGPYHFLAEHMKRGWWAISLIPFLFFCMVMYLGLFPVLRHDNYPAVVMLYMVLCLVYVVIYQVFQNTYARIAQENNGKMLSMQLEMQKQSMEQMKLLRHDYRHYIQNIGELLREGDTAGARQFIQRFEEQIELTKVPDYCENVTLNALFACHLEPARRSGIEIETHLELPGELPVDVVELSLVLANILENAVHACEKQPAAAHRAISVSSQSTPALVLEITNTYSGNIAFGRNGLPTTTEPGHGLGMRRVEAFLRKYHAFCDCEAADGLFRLRLLIPMSAEGERF